MNSSGSLPGWIGDGSGFDYNPRCLTRDINSYWSLKDLNYAKVQSAIVDTVDFAAFSERFAHPGLHSSGHFTIGGMNNDLFISPGDPAFYFHHAQVDRVWTLWQGRNLARRENELMGTTTWFNSKLYYFFLSRLFHVLCLPFGRDHWLVFFFAVAFNLIVGLILPNHLAPPSANITLSEPMDVGYLEETREVRYVMSTLDNGLCYIYE